MTSTQSDGEKTKSLSRNFDDWILAYREWAEPATDAPLSFIAWGALYSLASVIKRKVKLPRNIVGSFEVSPHIFLMFVGPPGLRKTSSIENFSLRLLSNVPGVNFSSTYFTKETLVTDLSTYSDSSISLVVGEFGEFMQKNKPAEMYDFLISLFDGGSKDQLTVSTFKRGSEIASKPCVNMITATTRSWISENMTENAIGGGFSSRVIYVNETELRDNGLLIYRKRLRSQGLDLVDMERKLTEDLIHISTLEGDFDLDEETEDYINEWFFKHREVAKRAPERMHGYYSRKPLMILKLAILHSLATKDELIINKENFDFGLMAMESTESSLKATFAGVGKNKYTLDLVTIKEYITLMGRASMAEVMREFISVGTQEQIQELLKTLIAMEEVVHDNLNGTDYFSPRDTDS